MAIVERGPEAIVLTLGTGDREDPEPCGLFRVGHDLHPIQCRLAWQRPWSVVTVAAEADGWMTIATEDGTLRRWSHQPRAVEQRIADHGPTMELRSGGVLAQPEPHLARTWWSVSIAEEPTSCTDDPDEPDDAPTSVQDIVDAVRGGRGLLLSADDLDALTDSGDPS